MEEELRRHPTALSLAGHSKELQVTEQTSQALPVHTPGLVRPGQLVLQTHRGWRCTRKEAAGSAQAPLCSEACAGAAALCAQPAPCSRHQGATQHGAKCVSEAQTPVLSLSKQPLLPESIPSCKLSTRLETGQL